MEEKRILFSITDNGETVDIKAEGETYELVQAFTAILKSSQGFRGIIKTSLEIATEQIREESEMLKSKWDA